MTPEIEKRIKAVKAGRVPAAHCLDGKKSQWNHLQISDLFDEVCEKNHPDADVLTIIQGTGTVLREESGREIIYDENSLASYKFVKKNDFIIHLRSFEGGLEVANQDGIVSPAYIILRPKIDVSTVYLYALFHSNQFINQTMAPAVEGARDGRSVKYDALKKQKIFLPPLSEQKKIAEILSVQDKIIELKEKLIVEKQLQKKSLAQMLFSVKKQKITINNTVIDKKKWKKEKIGELTYYSGKRNTKNLDLEPYAITNEQGFVPQNKAHDEFGYMKNVDRSAYVIVTPKSFAYNPARINVGSIGYYAGEKNVIVSSLYEVFKTKDIFDNQFFWQWLKTDIFPMWVKKLQEGSVRQYFYYDKLCECEILLPSLSEQQTIASVLSSADEEISLLQRDLEQEKLKKKSLMQLLLTGLVRV